MIALKKAGMPIRGAMDGLQANQKWAATHPIHKAGVELYKIPKQKKVGKLHHKLMVLDEQVVIAGSFNYTSPANRLNDENIIILGDLKSENQGSIEKQKRVAVYAKQEIDRIIAEFGHKVT
jgi:phosphatidylserine/phosphatidylglycerophosphate/cardiolipin synthase-like enzyme